MHVHTDTDWTRELSALTRGTGDKNHGDKAMTVVSVGAMSQACQVRETKC